MTTTQIPRRPKTRLDAALVERGLAPSREKAARLILAGAVSVDGRRVDKAGTLVAAASRIEAASGPRYVSRGGDKLVHALAAFGVAPRGRVCIDVGASTGGFTHCLLEGGATRVYAVDVGAGQLDAGLRADPRVQVMEGVNLEKVLPAVLGVLVEGGEAVVLVKPQFEVGKGQVGKGGVVRDPAQHQQVLERVSAWCENAGWPARGVTASPLVGPKGNREFFLHLAEGRGLADLAARIAGVVFPADSRP